MYLHKNGIRFDKIDSHDLPYLMDLKQESWWGTHQVLFSNSLDQQTWFENLPSNCLVLVGRHDRQFLGVCIISDIDWIARTANISGSVIEKARKGDLPRHAFEAGLDFAFEMLNLHRLNAEVLECNYVAQQIEITHLGFVIEGVKRASVYKCGRYYNSLVLGMLHEEWLSHPRVVGMGSSCNQNFDHLLARKLIERSRRSFQGPNYQNPNSSYIL